METSLHIFNENYNEVVNHLVTKSDKAVITNLKITYCIIGDLQQHTLHGYQNVLDLDLSNCCICLLENGVFSHLVHLKSINLSNNVIESISNAFDTNSKLQQINLKDNVLKSVCKTSFSVLEQLEILNLSYNNIWVLEEHFLNCPILKVLHLNNNEIKEVASSAFYQLPNLNTVILDDNKIEKLAANVFHKSINLRHLSLNNNGLSEISLNFLWKMTELKSLQLKNNLITQAIDNTLFSYNQNLFDVNLSDNNISGIQKDAFNNCRNMKSLKLSTYYTFNINSIKNLNSLTKFELFYRTPKGFSLTYRFWCIFKSKTDLTILKLIFQNIQVVQLCIFSHLINLEHLHIECLEPNNNYRDFNFSSLFRRMPKLKRLVFKKLNSFTVSKCSLQAENLKHLDLTGVKNAVIDFLFQGFRHLKYLNLSFSDVKYVSKYGFYNLPNLVDIDLQYSQIASIHSYVFKNNYKLKTINCSNCRIVSIDEFSFQNLQSLVLLDLRNNCLGPLSDNVFFGLNSDICSVLLS